MRQVELDVQVVVAERVVLGRVEHLEQGRRRVAAPVGADLVDLVEHDHRVHRAGIAQRAHQPPRQGADVRAPVAADLGLVADAAERHADELPPGRARDRLADRGLAGARRADQRQDDARAAVVGDAPLGAQLAHGQVLGDALLHVLEAGVVGVEHLARVHRIEPLLGALRPRHGDQPVEVGADHRRLAGLVAHPLQPAELALGLLAHGVGHPGLGDLGAVLLGDGRVVLAQLLADGVHLAPQQILALLLLRAGLDVLADALSDLELGQPAALEVERQRQPLDDVDGLEQLDLLLVGEVGRVAGRVGECARLGDRADERRHAAVVAAQLEDLLDGGAVLALELARLGRRRNLVGALLDLDPQAPLRVGLGGAGDAAVQRRELDGADAAGQSHALAHLGDDADLGVVALVTRDEQHLRLVPWIDRQGHFHAGEDDGVFEGDQKKFWHDRSIAQIVEVVKHPPSPL